MSRRDYIKHYTSPSQPSDAQAGDEWYNTSTNKIYKKLIDGGTSTSWIEISQQRNLSSLISSVPTVMTSISTITGTNTSSRISFTNIPQTYKNLQLIGRIASTTSIAQYYVCVDLYKNSVRQQLTYTYRMYYGNTSSSGNYSTNVNYATIWYGGTWAPMRTSGSLTMMFSDYTNHIACVGALALDHGSTGIMDGNFGITNYTGYTGFDQIDIYWTTTQGSAAGVQYLTTNTNLTLYGIS